MKRLFRASPLQNLPKTIGLAICGLASLPLAAFGQTNRVNAVPVEPAVRQDPLGLVRLPARGKLLNEKALTPFLRKLASARSTPIHIIQIGDSHTAGDLVTGGWRNIWQLEYGAGGRGMTAVGQPTSNFTTLGVTSRQTGAWQANALLGSRYAGNGPPLGPTGFTQTTSRAKATATLRADSAAFSFDQFSVCALTGPEMGSFKITFGKTEQDVSLTRLETGIECFNARSSQPETSVTLTTLEDKQVSFTSWTTRRGASGVILSNLGVVSARLQHWTRLNDMVLAQELKAAQPDLIVLAYGTNEGFFPNLSIPQEAATLRQQVYRLRQILGVSFPILLLGPPDATTDRPDLALPELPETKRCTDGRFMPGNIARIRNLQIQLAHELGLGFWDWQGAMGGPCSATLWTAQGMQRGDYIHFAATGGVVLGQALAADLDDARARIGGN